MTDKIQMNEEKGPPDLEDIFKKFTGGKKKPKKPSGGGFGGPTPIRPAGSSKGGIGLFIVVIIVLAIIWALSGIFIVKPAERAAVLRFGKYVNTVGPGPHWFPRFIESINRVNVDQVSAINLNSLMLTQNENIVSVQFVAQYRIGNLQNYLFNVDNPVDTLSQSLDSAVRQVIGHSTLDNILTVGRAAIAQKVLAQLEKLMGRYKTGIQVVDVTMQPATAPNPVKEAFDDVIKAREDKVRYSNLATSYANNVVPVAKGQAVRLIQQAKAASAQAVNNADAEVAAFDALLPQYKMAPAVTEERLYLETMEAVYSHNQVLVTSKSGHNVIYVPLDKTMSLPKVVVSKTVNTSQQSAAQNTTTQNQPADSASLMRKLAYLRWKEAQ